MNGSLRILLRNSAASRGTPAATTRRPLSLRIGKRLRRHVDTIVARFSQIPNDPVLSPTLFPWTRLLQDHWDEICQEAMAVTRNPDRVPALAAISPDHRRIAADENWRSFFLVGYGFSIDVNLRRCPRTAEVLRTIPALNSGFFSILRPGAHIPAHRGVTKGLVTCHLGLQVPSGSGLRMRVATNTVSWREGGILVFDDTYEHEVWNDTDETRVVLLIQFGRPLRQPGRAVAAAFLAGIRRSAFVREATRNIALWEENVRGLETVSNR